MRQMARALGGMVFVATASAACGRSGATDAAAPVASPASPSVAPTVAAGAAAAAGPIALRVRAIPLPGAPERVSIDYLAYDPATKVVWIPAGNTKRVDTLDTTSGAVGEIAGFPTRQHEARGVVRYLGPSSATVGDGVVYVGNRGDSNVCSVHASTRARLGCVQLLAVPDGIAYVRATKEIWVTTREKALTIVDAHDPAAMKATLVVPVEGEPEGYAVDQERGLFFTNLEDKDRTLVIDARTRKVTTTWSPGCGEDGPRGLAYDAARRFLFVACTDKVVALDANGKTVGTLATGAGVDNIDYAPGTKRLFAAAGTAAKLTVAAVDDRGALVKIGEVATAEGARAVVADGDGRAYVADSARGRMLVAE